MQELKLPPLEQQGREQPVTYLMEAVNGMQVWVVASRAQDWLKVQREHGTEPLSVPEQELKSRILQKIFASGE